MVKRDAKRLGGKGNRKGDRGTGKIKDEHRTLNAQHRTSNEKLGGM
jgi:hypothetical protein